MFVNFILKVFLAKNTYLLDLNKKIEIYDLALKECFNFGIKKTY